MTKTCDIPECPKAVVARGWCVTHYERWKTHGDPMKVILKVRKVCIIEGCQGWRSSRGLCGKHRAREKRHGDPLLRSAPRPERGCDVDGCQEPHVGRGYCSTHYARLRRIGTTSVPEVPVKTCEIDGCDGKCLARGWCSKHYDRWKDHGDPLGGGRPRQKQANVACAAGRCSKTCVTNGYCQAHYDRWRRYEDLDYGIKHVRSAAEKEMAAFVDSLGVETRHSDRTLIAPLEVDLYIPSTKLAVEYNGLYWHGEDRRGRDYHQAKWAACKAVGVQLIQIWEDDWVERREIIEAMLRRKILGGQSSLGARKTELVKDPEGARDFLNKHHIQGWVGGSQVIGLCHPVDGLVALGTFRRRPNGDMELTRYAATRPVVGGLRRIMAATGGTEFVTFADHCISDGHLYETTGWKVDEVLAPDYRYVVGKTRQHKFNYRLARFRDDPNLLWQEGATERELADLNGLPRIWDAGKTRYRMSLLP